MAFNVAFWHSIKICYPIFPMRSYNHATLVCYIVVSLPWHRIFPRQ
jgi:hypothetical protein